MNDTGLIKVPKLRRIKNPCRKILERELPHNTYFTQNKMVNIEHVFMTNFRQRIYREFLIVGTNNTGEKVFIVVDPRNEHFKRLKQMTKNRKSTTIYLRKYFEKSPFLNLWYRTDGATQMIDDKNNLTWRIINPALFFDKKPICPPSPQDIALLYEHIFDISVSSFLVLVFS